MINQMDLPKMSSMDDRMKDLREPEPRLALEGVLQSIPEVGPMYTTRMNETYGPGGIVTREFVGGYTMLRIKTGDGEKDVRYDGTVFPDSIGHRVQIYERCAHTSIFDQELERWYR